MGRLRKGVRWRLMGRMGRSCDGVDVPKMMMVMLVRVLERRVSGYA